MCAMCGAVCHYASLCTRHGVQVIAADDNCTAIHASMMPIETDDVDMDDIMSEMAAEAEQEKEEQCVHTWAMNFA